MFKSALREAPRRIASSRTTLTRSPARRFLSTAPPAQKSRGWKSSAVRWALAGAGVYYYNTSSLFEEEPEASIHKLDESIQNVQESKQPTVDAIVEEKRRRQAQVIAEEENKQRLAEGTTTTEGEADGEQELEDLEEEAGQQGAFNPETGEINWDCPCLGGMAHGTCGEEFKAAFSCFVYSTEEPKGVECIEKFKGMQDCFRKHPEEYGSEMEDDEDEVEEEIRARESIAESGEEPSKSPSTQASENSAAQPAEGKKPAVAKQAEQNKPAEESHHDSGKLTAASVSNTASPSN
ncbi:CHCH domain-containing protein [Drepanopeziza brunnea f. sp. 'multigermtubi' MB_m1]|uniref:Mitochondrial intermembrane space import and assembly protein 40 n=1 Tax=Marssonina brunnea f. sp. multigermtubi (strain MB_m1) TaxID=1072389 RepID=K1XC19_MARBU|nr:CHCH domain-containing protein [Drepanopeziza brunnea f. sp. 'multigermtubi' MB_m1]EKD18298.1 CHCH domain-containing protein [Drepanopeziza brunnea f. sp. 'multigermtubi' MB_m1]